jgi:hypothetical protein
MPDRGPEGPPFFTEDDSSALALPSPLTEPDFDNDISIYLPLDTDLDFDWNLINQQVQSEYFDEDWTDPVAEQPQQVVDVPIRICIMHLSRF